MKDTARHPVPGHRPERRRPVRTAAAVLLTLLASSLVDAAASPAAAAACTGSAVACENLLPGSPASEWDITGAGDDSLQGFATSISVDVGQVLDLKVKTDARAYTVQIYRLGWYGGDGAREVAAFPPSAALPQVQPACVNDPATGLYDCGTWRKSASWSVPSDAVSGVYVAKLTRPDTGGASHVPFVVRHDVGQEDLVFQTSDTTWQAYNTYGGSNFYTGPAGRALKLSYNRPFATRTVGGGRDYLFGNEYPLIRFLERNGYDVSYISGLDTHRAGALLTNHQTFLSVGHDEYWSGAQRTNVETARDAGVNLAFLSGNEVYWKTRWEPSIDGSATADRTLVCYKETWDEAKTDPSAEWTGTWRDPRFSPPSDGGRPENALTGTAYVSNFTDLAVEVSAEEGRRRLWRGTAAATQAPGQKLTLAPSTIGYESDEDLDNGFRPPGLIRLSTTTGPTPQYLRDYGLLVTPGTTTHHLTSYRAASGALVFSAGTVQWTWGLDPVHDGGSAPADPVMQQATINLLADMRAQPTTLMSGMTTASASADSAAPTATITSPSAGQSLPNGDRMTVTGTATDTGGVVAGIEVSTDSGASWHPAAGTTSWSYSYTQQGLGVTSVRARATDDSNNTGPAVTTTTTTTCPCSVRGTSSPVAVDAGDGSDVELGLRFSTSVAGYVTGVRFYKSTANTGEHTGSLWTATGSLLATGTFTGGTVSGWQTLAFEAPVAVVPGQTYTASYHAPRGHYAADKNAFNAAAVQAPPLTVPRSTAGSGNGVFSLGAGFPSRTFAATDYGVDVVFDDKDTSPPAVLVMQPLAGSSSVAASVSPSAVLSESVDPDSLSFSVTDEAGAAVPGAVTWDSSSRRVTFTPTGLLQRGVLHTAAVRATDLTGNAMPRPRTWSFRTARPAPLPEVCPCSLWDDAATPAQITVNDPKAVELGVVVSAEGDGMVRAVRFYKGPLNVGSHTVSLWSMAGQRLATASSSGESSTGWQTVAFATPVSVGAETSYVASYSTTSGYYSATADGLGGQGVLTPPLRAAAGGGRYRYGGGFPDSTSGTNYWVDVEYVPSPTAVPTVTRVVPADGSTNVHVGTTVTAKFGGAVENGSASLSVVSPGGPVPGTTGYDSTTRTLTFTPSAALQPSATYTATVSGARAPGGGQMSPASSSWTTAGLATCPCTLFSSTAVPTVVDSGDGNRLTVGVRVVPSSDGQLTAVRFYKSASNTGAHTVSVWSANGTRLAHGAATGETPSGWQTALLSAPVAVTAGETYVVAYYAPVGHYSVDRSFFATPWTNGPLTAPTLPSGNGLFSYGDEQFPTSSSGDSNYWVDAVFRPGAPTDTTGPSALSTVPLDRASSVALGVRPSVVLSEDVVASSLLMTVRGTSSGLVAGEVAYDAGTRTASYTPTVPLARADTFVVTVHVPDATGNPGTATWTFRTVLPAPVLGQCPCSLWDDATVPAVVTAADGGSVELGLAFRTDVAAAVSGVRFHKGPSNVGQHTVSLWSSSGERLATAPSAGESSTGWQTVSFAAAVPVAAGTSYTVSYRAPVGRYSVDAGQFAASGRDVPPLHADADAGRYSYGSGAPSNGSASNYWVDPVLVPAPDVKGPVVTALTSTGTGATATVTWTTDEPATGRVDYGTSSTLTSSAVTAATGTAHQVQLTGLTPSTRYAYRVVATDLAGNATTAPSGGALATHVPTVQPFSQSSTTDFTGTRSNTYVSTYGGGEVVLTPTQVAEFDGSTLASDWSSSAVVSGGTTVVAQGSAAVSGARLSASATRASARSLLAAATFTARDQRLGWGSTATASALVHASFATLVDGALVAQVDDGRTRSTAPLPSTLVGAPHEFRIQWTSSLAVFLVDEVEVARLGFSPSVSLKPLARDAVTGDPALAVDWIRVGPYAASGTHTSGVLDAGAPVGWDGVSVDTSVVAGGALTVQVRTGPTPAPGTGWSGWTTAPAGGLPVGRTSRYLQFRLQLSAGTDRSTSPSVRSVLIRFHVL